jgi:hypothetical protein
MRRKKQKIYQKVKAVKISHFNVFFIVRENVSENGF